MSATLQGWNSQPPDFGSAESKPTYQSRVPLPWEAKLSTLRLHFPEKGTNENQEHHGFYTRTKGSSSSQEESKHDHHSDAEAGQGGAWRLKGAQVSAPFASLSFRFLSLLRGLVHPLRGTCTRIK